VRCAVQFPPSAGVHGHVDEYLDCWAFEGTDSEQPLPESTVSKVLPQEAFSGDCAFTVSWRWQT
jgi:hypothetical protein